MGWLTDWFRRLGVLSSPSEENRDSFEELVWLEPEVTSFGVRVLDCRPIVQTLRSATLDEASIRFLGSPESLTGDQFRGQHPEESICVACDLKYPLDGSLREGPLCLAQVMEEKWNIYHFDGVLYFVRSWTGHLQYTAKLNASPGEIHVVEIQAWPGKVLGVNELAVRQVDYMIRTHLYRQAWPNPVPHAMQTKKNIAMWSFSEYGHLGWYAAVETEP